MITSKTTSPVIFPASQDSDEVSSVVTPIADQVHRTAAQYRILREEHQHCPAIDKIEARRIDGNTPIQIPRNPN